MTRVILVPTYELSFGLKPDLTVEAEYGAFVVEGAKYTAAHHGQWETKYQGVHEGGAKVAPCIDYEIPTVHDGLIMVSHIDADTIGGVLRALSQQPSREGDEELEHSIGSGYHELFPAYPNDPGLGKSFCQTFWELVAFADTMGPHRIHEFTQDIDDICKTEAAIDALYAYWMWSQQRLAFRRDIVTDITEEVHEHGRVLSVLLGHGNPTKTVEMANRLTGIPHSMSARIAADKNNPDALEWAVVLEHDLRAMGHDVTLPLAQEARLLAAGQRLVSERNELNENTIVGGTADVIIRHGRVFLNHLYERLGSKQHAKAIVAFDTRTQEITISCYENYPMVDCRAIAKYLWGSKAGGHRTIAASPRGLPLSPQDVQDAFIMLSMALGAEDLDIHDQHSRLIMKVQQRHAAAEAERLKNNK